MTDDMAHAQVQAQVQAQDSMMRMTPLPGLTDTPPPMPQGIKKVLFRRGNRTYSYYYHRATGKPLTAAPGTPEFLAQAARMDLQARRICHSDATLPTLITAYRGSQDFAALASRTRQSYELAFAWLEQLDRVPLAQMGMRSPYRLRDRAARERNDRFAAGVLGALRVLLAWGKPRGFIIALETRGRTVLAPFTRTPFA